VASPSRPCLFSQPKPPQKLKRKPDTGIVLRSQVGMTGPVILPYPSGARAARPYLALQSREVEAVSGWRLGTQSVNGGLGEPRPTIPPPEAIL